MRDVTWTNMNITAKEYAELAHRSIKQVRKYTGEPYEVHANAVADIVARFYPSKPVIDAAYLHDVIEDVTPHNPAFNIDQIRELFGEVVADLVIELTHVYTTEAYPGLNRKERKRRERIRMEHMTAAAQTIKLADVFNNTQDIVSHDPEFAKVYLAESLLLLPHLRGGSESLFKVVQERLDILISNLGTLRVVSEVDLGRIAHARCVNEPTVVQ